MRMMKFLPAVLLGMLFLFARPAAAQLNFTFSNNAPVISGSSLPYTFTIDLTNGSQVATINGFSAVFGTPGAPNIDLGPFFDYVSGLGDTVPANYSDTGVSVFSVVAGMVSPGIYDGMATLSFDRDGINVETVTQNFQVQITSSGSISAPEPASLCLIFLPVVAGFSVARRKEHKAA